MEPREKKTGGGKGARRVRKSQLPVKRDLNLAGVTEQPIDWRVGLPAILVILALAAAFGRFAVYDRMAAAARAQAEAAAVRLRLDQVNEALESYGDVAGEYAHYTIDGMTEEELTRPARTDVVDLLRQVVLPRLEVNSWSVQGSAMTVNVTGGTLREINLTAQAMEEDRRVEFCAVSTAETDPLEERIWEGERVTANLLVYLTAEGEEGGSEG